MAMFEMKPDYRFRIYRQCCFMKDSLRINGKCIIVKNDIKTVMECIEKIREFSQERCLEREYYIDSNKQTCLPDQNLVLELPRELNKKTYIMLRGEHCVCKLYIEMYYCNERRRQYG